MEERNRCIVIYFGPVDECHRQATRCFNSVDPELDPSPCGNARAAPSTGSGRERGCDGTGRTLAFPSKKKNKLWIWLAFDRSGQRLVDWECGNRDAATLNRLLERLKPWSVTLYCTDDYAPYDTLLPVGGTTSARIRPKRSRATMPVSGIGSPVSGGAPAWSPARPRWSRPPWPCSPTTTATAAVSHRR